MDNKTRNIIITVAVVVVLGAVALKLVKAPKGGNNGDGDNDDGSGSGGGGNSGGGGTTSGLDFRALANQIFEACDGYGTDEVEIALVFNKLKNNADFDALYDAYGIREVSSGRGNIFQSNFVGDLSATLRNELGSSYIDNINKSLSSKGITRQI